MTNQTKLTVSPEEKGLRLDVFLAQKMDLSRSYTKKLVMDGHVTVNGKPPKASHLSIIGDVISVEIPAPTKLPLEPVDIPLNIIYEDADIIIINKQAGLVVHPGAGTYEPTLVHAVLHHCKDLSTIGGIERPGIIHRLDKDTTGLILVAKNDKAHQLLSAQFKNRTISKTYLALVEGIVVNPEGEINLYIGRNPGNRQKMMTFKTPPPNLNAKTALTRYKVISEKNSKTLLEVDLLTGRTHQIRVHMAAIGHPLVGDPLYRGNSKVGRQFLHSYRVAFDHPGTGERMTFTTEMPEWAKPYIK